MTSRRAVRWSIVALVSAALVASGGATASAAGPKIDPKSKVSVAKAYLKAETTYQVGPGWTGEVKGCKVGKNSAAHDKASLEMANWARAMGGLKPLRWNAAWAKEARAHALVSEASGILSHYVDKSFRCYSKAAKSGGVSSNITWGTHGADSVMGYMVDDGLNNVDAGHRRWILDPRITQIGVGSTDNASSMKIFKDGSSVPDLKGSYPRFVGWPTAGYFPYEAEPLGRWSLSAPDASFAKAKVTVRDAQGKKVATYKPTRAQGYGSNSIVFDLKKPVVAPKGKAASVYTVKVTGIRWPGAKKGPSSHTYKVKLINARDVAGAK